jgi:hypothetical protein
MAAAERPFWPFGDRPPQAVRSDSNIARNGSVTGTSFFRIRLPIAVLSPKTGRTTP